MDRFEEIKTLERAKELFNDSFTYETRPKEHFVLPQLWAEGERAHKPIEDRKEIWQHILDTLPPIRLVTWKDIKKLMNEGDLQEWGGLINPSLNYFTFVHKGWTADLRENHPIGGGSMDYMIEDGVYEQITGQDEDPVKENQVAAVYYHAAKAHWLINNIQKEGLWQPIQGHTKNGKLNIHPGSMRCQSFQAMDEPNMTCLVTDYSNCFPNHPSLNVDNLLDFWTSLVPKGRKNISGIWTDQGKIEINVPIDHGGTDFRKQVHAFNRKVHKLTKKKPINIYIGYDSSHDDIIHEVAEKSIHDSIEKSKCKGVGEEFFEDYKIEVKRLDYSKISVYNREYAQQSTEFTYSRFLIPYLENYEGFSFFIDNDYIWQRSPLPLFYFLDPDNAVACVQYDFEHHDEVKMGGEKNVSYPKKLWSSMMIFNNGHEDCRKLTPELINTASGQYLHQFQWTDKVSKIPHGKIATEGFDTKFQKTEHAIHYTRGGPWIKGMDTSNINMLGYYDRVKNGLPKNN